MKTDRAQAFPRGLNDGMELRDYFAAKAMSAIISNSVIAAGMANMKVGMTVDEMVNFDKEVLPRITAEAAYTYADAMMKARRE